MASIMSINDAVPITDEKIRMPTGSSRSRPYSRPHSFIGLTMSERSGYIVTIPPSSYTPADGGSG